MIYTDEDGIVNIEYGHGSIMGMQAEYPGEPILVYSLIPCDKHEIGELCKDWEKNSGKTDVEHGATVRLKFSRNKLSSV